MRVRHEWTKVERYRSPFGASSRSLEDLLLLRRIRVWPGHAEMAGRRSFLKWNTGTIRHGMPPDRCQAVALKIAGAEEVKVFAVEGGRTHAGSESRDAQFAWVSVSRISYSFWTGRLRHRT